MIVIHEDERNASTTLTQPDGVLRDTRSMCSARAIRINRIQQNRNRIYRNGFKKVCIKANVAFVSENVYLIDNLIWQNSSNRFYIKTISEKNVYPA